MMPGIQRTAAFDGRHHEAWKCLGMIASGVVVRYLMTDYRHEKQDFEETQLRGCARDIYEQVLDKGIDWTNKQFTVSTDYGATVVISFERLPILAVNGHYCWMPLEMLAAN